MVKIKLYGAFRQFEENLGREIHIPIDAPITVGDLKVKILNHIQLQVPSFRDSNLIFESAIGNSTHILGNEALIESQANLVILPPVCGG